MHDVCPVTRSNHTALPLLKEFVVVVSGFRVQTNLVNVAGYSNDLILAGNGWAE